MPDPKDPGLNNSINELESLVDNKPAKKRISVVGDQRIPILDEVITPEDYEDYPEEYSLDEDEEPHFEEIVDKVEKKLSHELDEIVNLLKGNLKDSILHELQDQIKREHDSDKED